jgi:hypothetical protein
MAERALTPELQHMLTDLIVEDRNPANARGLTDEKLGQLRAALERALIDRAYLGAYLDHLRTRLGSDLPGHLPLTEEEEGRVIEEGLGALLPYRLAQLALDRVALLCLRAALFQREELSDYWWQRARQFAEEEGALNTPEEILAELKLDEIEEPAAGEPVGTFGEGPSAEEGGPPEQPRRWLATLPLGEEAKVEYSWWPARTPPELEVRLFGILSPSAEIVCRGRVLDAAGQVLAEADYRDRHLVFALPRPDLTGLTLECEYQREDGFHLSFGVALS